MRIDPALDPSSPALPDGAPSRAGGGARASLERIEATRPEGALCHAVRRRADAGDDREISARFEAAITRWFAPAREGTSRPRLWCESVPFPRRSPAAAARRSSELARPLGARDGRGVRAVLLRYEDGADLILVARRAALDRRALEAVARAVAEGPDAASEDPGCATGSAVFSAASSVAADVDAPSEGSAGREWGLGGEPPGAGVARYRGAPLTASADPAAVLAALGLVLSRFNGEDGAVLAALASDRDAAPDSAVGGREGVALFSIDCGGAKTAAALVDAIRRRSASPLGWYAPAVAQASGHDQGVAIGVWTATGSPRDEAGSEYRSCLAPPFPLTIDLETDAAGVTRLAYAFDRDRFSPSMVEALDRAVGTVQPALSADPSARLSSVTLLDASEAARVADLGRPTRPLVFDPARIERSVAQVASSRPGAIALSCDGRRMTYAELEERSSKMAHALRGLGIREGDRVGVSLDRSVDLVVSLLAVMKAGAAYVPMDPAYPPERLSYTTADAKLSLVVSDVAGFPSGDALRVVAPERLLALAATAPATPPAHAAGANDPAYVIYTSGSTGRPKGVVVPHRNVSALLAATRDDFALGPDDVWTLFHSSAFDFSVWEIWGCLMTGGHLVVVPYWVSRSPEDFADLLAREHVTILNQTPSAFAQLQEAERSRAGTLALRLVIFGGEALDSRMLLRWFDRHPESDCRMVNMFGITETTVHVTAETVGRRHALTASRTVGPALPGWHCYVMDRERHLLPAGVSGEIYVGGAGVALQYLDRPELTADRFLVDPFTGAPMYRSGDKGRLRADGRLEHLGRLDGQVKIRGFRIELDEIRSVLLECAAVAAAAVVVNRTAPDDPATARLDAYVVLKGGSVADVRLHAARLLPEHMRPSTVTAVPALPLTTNGKLDMRRLPPPAIASNAAAAPVPRPDPSPTSTARSSAAADPLESALRRIWSEVIGRDVGPDDNFFELGGNSLFAVRIAAAMRKHKLPSLPMRELYVHQTIRHVAGFLRAQQASA